MVLYFDGDFNYFEKQTPVQEFDLQWTCTGRRWQENVQVQKELNRPHGDCRQIRGGRRPDLDDEQSSCARRTTQVQR